MCRGSDDFPTHIGVAGGRTREAEMICAARLPRFLKQLGGAFPKAGQILSTRSDLLPELICQALARLQDDTSPMPHKQVEQALQMDGIGERVLFLGCIRRRVQQSHRRAELCDGRIVALKIQRPGVPQMLKG